MPIVLVKRVIIAHVHGQEYVTVLEIEKPATPGEAPCRRKILVRDTTRRNLPAL